MSKQDFVDTHRLTTMEPDGDIELHKHHHDHHTHVGYDNHTNHEKHDQAHVGPADHHVLTAAEEEEEAKPIPLWRQVLAEILGTFVLLSFGIGCVAQTVYSDGAAGNSLTIYIGWAVAVLLGICTAGAISGAHLNPSVTVSLAVYRGFPKSYVLPFIGAQVLGAFMAAVVCFLVYHEANTNYDGGIRSVTGPTASAGVYATYPQAYLSTGGGVLDQIVGTAFLILLIFGITDPKAGVAPSTQPIAVASVVLGVGCSFGVNCGFAINPARDLGPRLFTLIGGYGTETFTAGNNWWWVPIVAPLIGGVLGGGIYQAFIGWHHDKHDAVAAKK
jgi:aquaglyceroporin related protein